MEWFEWLVRYTHITFGFVGLAAFWIPIFSRKGGRTHVRFGKIFVNCAYVVLGSAGLSVIYYLGKLALSGVSPADEPDSYGFLIFLGYLAYVTAVIVRYALRVLQNKRNPVSIATPFNRAMAFSSIGMSVVIVAYAVYFDPSIQVVLFALSPVGFLSGMGQLNYMNGKQMSPRAWMYEHLGAMLGAGIAFHTAFAVFGAGRFLDLGITGAVAVIPWVLPTVIGVPATFIWTRHYQHKFGELASRTAEVQ